MEIRGLLEPDLPELEPDVPGKKRKRKPLGLNNNADRSV